MSGFTDEPKRRKTDDEFQVGRYITGLSRFIKQCNTPMTIAIQGDWGSGKTSIMNMVRDELGDSVIPVWFNTWQYSQFDMGDQLSMSMIGSLISELAPTVGAEEIRDMVTGLGTIFVDRFMGDKAASWVEKHLIGDEETSVAAIGKLKEKFQQCITKACAKKKRERVVVFVDDLDRLQPTRAVELLEVLKLFLDCRQCVFVLAIDYEVVSRGIEQKFGLNDREKSRSFFDKIIQVPFKMPVAQYDLDQYVKGVLKELKIEADDELRGTYLELIRRSVGYNPRSMKRLFNIFSLLDCIQQDEREVWDRGMLLGVLCMQLVYEDVYNFLAERRELLSEETLRMLLEETDNEASAEDEREDLPEPAVLAAAQGFLEVFLDFIKPETPENLIKLREVFSLSAITSTVPGLRKEGNGQTGKGARYAKTYDEQYRDIPISEPVEKTNGKDGWNGALLKEYVLKDEAPVPVKNFNTLMLGFLEKLYEMDARRFMSIAENPDELDSLSPLFRGCKKGGSGFVQPRTLSFGVMVDLNSSYNTKVRQLRSMMQGMGMNPSTLRLRLKLAHRVENA